MHSYRHNNALVFLIALAGAGRVVSAVTPQAPVTAESAGFGEFTSRVQAYVKVQKALPRIRTTRQREEIIKRRHALAEKIRVMRAKAKPGDIFTPAATDEFRRVIRLTLQGPGASGVLKTIRQEPVPGGPIPINGDYPEYLPMTTVPPTLLRRFPQLPPEVAYRIVGHDLVLQDTEARVVVDFIVGALP